MNAIGPTNFDPLQNSGSNQAQIMQVLAELGPILQAVFAALKQSSADGGGPSGGNGGGSGASGFPTIRIEIGDDGNSSNGDNGGGGNAPTPFTLNAQSPQNAPPPDAGAPQGNGQAGGQSQPPAQNGSTLPANSGGSAANAIANDLRSRYGLNDTQIAGVLGNLQQESGLKPNVNQGGAEGAPSGNFADDNANGWGLAQWGGARKQGEIAYAKQHNLDPGSLDANIGYMNQELDGPYSKTISDLKNTTNVSQAAQVWDTDYEQATDPQMDNRLQYAQNFLKEGL
ncbi:hypothetical protein BFF94_007160 [Burkholderia catarinensis]|nr:hypothetical protein BFF94_007160 [Burkholderia catarinensis]